jgi:hypothetical protein
MPEERFSFQGADPVPAESPAELAQSPSVVDRAVVSVHRRLCSFWSSISVDARVGEAWLPSCEQLSAGRRISFFFSRRFSD